MAQPHASSSSSSSASFPSTAFGNGRAPPSAYNDNDDSDDDDDDGQAAFTEARADIYHSSDDSDDEQDDDWHDPSELADLIEQAAKCKAEGNAHFTAQRNNAAMEAYREGIAILPLRKIPPKEKKSAQDSGGKGKQREDPSSSDDESIKEEQQSNTQIRELADEEDEKAFVAQGKISDEEKQVIELRGALWNNLAAAQMRLSLYKEAATSATEALKDSPDNIKALQRRATANEKLDTWTSLTSALEDYNYLAKLPDLPKASLPAIRQAQRTIPPRLEQRKTQETQEMMDKLKGLGNSFLGKFGMSTDNFQFVKNEETGGYSMNFVQNPGK
ncbi:hypothetical protein P389DRAFT_195183 [Cystobasidium minutum MCA 4210]|uniref:uncharacterized protein n=1 Tax=Cystobasidium minutum MCA 4210 TaxID=1397322 RepID=UPI0034CE9962|eukprot:jgi/Rhomi1/195183/gm1.3397_g